MLAFLNNLGLTEMVVIAMVAVLIFGKNLPQAASKAYIQIRKLRNAMDDIRRESGIDKEIRDIERTVREAEWEARRAVRVERGQLPQKTTPTEPGGGNASALPPPVPPSPPGPPSESHPPESRPGEPHPPEPPVAPPSRPPAEPPRAEEGPSAGPTAGAS